MTSTAADIAALQASVATLQTSLTTLQGTVASLASTVGTPLQAADANSFYLLVVGLFVFFMQAGFALLEAGTVRSKNAKNILMKNLLDACIGALIWWGWGYGLAYENGGGSQGFIGHIGPNSNFASSNFFAAGYTAEDSGNRYAAWWFQFIFAAAAATIVSGAMAERTTLIGYFIYTVVLTVRARPPTRACSAPVLHAPPTS